MQDKCSCVWPMLNTIEPTIVAFCRPGYLLADPNEITKLRYYAPDDVKAELARGGCADVEECETVANGADCIVKCEEKEVTIEFMTLRELTEESLQALYRHIKKGTDILVLDSSINPIIVKSLASSMGVSVVEADIKDLLNVCYSDYNKGTIMLVSLSEDRVIKSGGKKVRSLVLR